MNARRKKQNARGQSLAEVVMGILILVPVILFFLDIIILVICQSLNDNLAKNIARACAALPTTATSADLTNVSNHLISKFAATPLASTTAASTFATVTIANDSVAVKTTMTVNLLVPVPFAPKITIPPFTSQAQEARTAVLAQ